MGKKIVLQEGMTFNAWKILEANVINPETTSKTYQNKTVFSKCICTKCNKTIKYFLNSKLTSNPSHQCHSCELKERNQKSSQESAPKIGDKFGHLTVIGDGGFKEHGTKGKHRHCSICQCVCGNVVTVLDNALKTGNTTSCGCICSKGEQIIKNILDKNNIIYQYDVTFPLLIEQTNRRLRFDFIIYNKDNSINRFVEFDGNQHKTGMWGGSWSNLETFEVIHERDQIKNDFCVKNNFTLVRIPYYKISNLTLGDIMGDKFIYKGE